MPVYRRNRVPGGCYFFTVTLLERRRTLLVDHIDGLRDAVRRVRRRYPFVIDAWVVLPDHLHCVWTLPPGGDAYPTRWRLIKLLFVKALPKTERRSTVRQKRGERGIWQRRYWEHTIRDDQDYERHVDYAHVNPVRHGLVTRVGDWPYSTFHRAIAAGRLPPDWGGDAARVGRISGAAALRLVRQADFGSPPFFRLSLSPVGWRFAPVGAKPLPYGLQV